MRARHYYAVELYRRAVMVFSMRAARDAWVQIGNPEKELREIATLKEILKDEHHWGLPSRENWTHHLRWQEESILKNPEHWR